MANLDLMASVMAVKGTYAIYGFLLGALFTALSLAIIFVVLRTSSKTTVHNAKKVRKTVLQMLFVAVPVALCFLLIFCWTMVELTLHRHGERFEYYITQFLCSELIALAFLLVHYWRVGLKIFYNERDGKARVSRHHSFTKTVTTTIVSDALSSGISDLKGNDSIQTSSQLPAAAWESSSLSLKI